jgi:hypothetical protein
MNVLVICPQGGQPEAEFNARIADAIRMCGGDVSVNVASLRRVDANAIRHMAPAICVLQSFEEFCDENPPTEVKAEALRLAREYPQADWWSVAIAERNLVDSSFLLGGAGERPESQSHVELLIVNMARYFEAVFSSGRFAAVVGQVADSLIMHVFYQVARRFDIRAIALSPNAWIREDGKPGFYIGRDEFVHCDRMEELYRVLVQRELSENERQRVAQYRNAVIEFNVVHTFQAITKRPFIAPALSPNLKRLWSYLRENAVRRRDIEYYKIDIGAKAKANLLRVWRRLRSRNLLGSGLLDVPEHNVFYPMQYQPEQTTLVGGLYFANQISTIENIAKSLPFGYTLIVKEHPRGRGARPAWQYRHLARFPNIRFCDADSKEIMKRCGAVITITSTAGLEAMALDRPIVVLGSCYYDFADIIYKPKSWPDLAQTLRRILVDGEYEKNAQRQKHIDCFFLAYLLARRPVLLSNDTAPAVGQFICDELGLPAPAPERLARAV